MSRCSHFWEPTFWQPATCMSQITTPVGQELCLVRFWMGMTMQKGHHTYLGSPRGINLGPQVLEAFEGFHRWLELLFWVVHIINTVLLYNIFLLEIAPGHEAKCQAIGPGSDWLSSPNFSGMYTYRPYICILSCNCLVRSSEVLNVQDVNILLNMMITDYLAFCGSTPVDLKGESACFHKQRS